MTARTRPERPANSPWFTQEEAAAHARSNYDTVGDALRSGELRGYQAGKGGKWRIHRDDIDAWIRGEIAPVVVPNLTRRVS